MSVDGAALARFALYGGLTLAAGLVTVQRLVTTDRMADDSRGPIIDPDRALWPWYLLTVLLLLGAPIALLELQRTALELPRAELPVLLRETSWGAHWLQLLLAAMMTTAGLAALLAAMAWRGGSARDPRPRGLASLPMLLTSGGTVAMAAAMSGLGHAAADSEWPRVSRAADSIHALASAIWIGGLGLTAWLLRRTPAATGQPLWSAFSRMATVAAPLVVVTGGIATWRRLGAPDVGRLLQSLGTPYGQLLAAKGAAVLVVVALGARQRRRLAAAKHVEPRAIGTELLVALLVFGLTAVLTGTEPPAQRP